MEISVNDLSIEKFTLTESADAAIMYKGNLTFVAIDIDGAIGVGVSACMPSDKYSKDIGAGIAIARAIKHVAEITEKTWLERAVTKEEWAKRHGNR